MLELYYSLFNLSSEFNERDFNMYVYGKNGTYYYGFIDLETKIFTLNTTQSHIFRDDISLIIIPEKFKPYKDRDDFFVGIKSGIVFGSIKRTYIRSIELFATKKFDKNGLKFFNMLD